MDGGCGCSKQVLGAIHETALRRLRTPAPGAMAQAQRLWEAMHRVPPQWRRRILRSVLEAYQPGSADRVEKTVAVLNARGTHVPSAMRVALARVLSKPGRGDPMKHLQRARAAVGPGLGLFGEAGVTWPIPIDPMLPYNQGGDGPQWSTARNAYKRVQRRLAREGEWGYRRIGTPVPRWNQGLPYSGEEMPPRRRRRGGLGLFDPRRAGEFWPEPPEDRPYVIGPMWDSLSMQLAPRSPGIGAIDPSTITADRVTSWSCNRATGELGVRIDGGAKVPVSALPAGVRAQLRDQIEKQLAWCRDPKLAAAAQASAATQAQKAAAANAKADSQYAKRMEQYGFANQFKKGLRETTADIVGTATSAVTTVGGGVLKGLAPLLLPALVLGLGAMYLMRRASAPVVKVGA